jgi:hypothetical protein
MKQSGNILDAKTFALSSSQDFALRFRFKFMLWDGAKYEADQTKGHVVETPRILLARNVKKTLVNIGWTIPNDGQPISVNFTQQYTNLNNWI